MSVPIPAVLPPDVSRGPTLLKITWATFGIATLVMGGRLYSKISLLRRLATDDVLMIIAWLCIAAYSVCVQLAINYGFGRHYEYLFIPVVVKLFKCLYGALAFCIAGPMLGRISFMIYMLAIIGRARHSLRYLLWTSIFLQVVFNVALVFVIYSACGSNMEALINPTTTCFKRSPWFRFGQAVSSLNVVSDMALMISPTLLVWRLRTPMKAKMAAVALLSLSSLAMLAAIWRTIELDTVFTADWDFTYDAVPFFEASSLEQNIIIISASLPTLGPVIRHLRRKWHSGSTTTSTNSSRPLSGDSAEIQYNLARALGMKMPGLGNSVEITAGGTMSRDSQEYILPLSALPAIKTTTRTDVKVEYMAGEGGEDEQLSPIRAKKKLRF